MSRTFAILWHYLSWQRLMIWIGAVGWAAFVAGWLLPAGAFAFALGALGGIFAMGFQTMLGGIAFRQLVANRHFTPVPALREHAVIALALLALIGTAMAVLIFRRLPAGAEVPAAIGNGPALFALVSIFLLVSQWLAIYTFGIALFVLLPLLQLRVLDALEPAALAFFGHPVITAAAALAGWAWLYVSMRRATNVPGIAQSGWGGFAGTGSSPKPVMAPSVGRPRSPIGTLMRGGADSLAGRFVAIVLFPAAFPAIVIAVLLVFGMPLNVPQLPFFALVLSFYGITLAALLLPAEWPARLRYVWLKGPGDRSALWRRLERGLLGDVGMLALVTIVVAATFRLSGTVPAGLVWLYAAGTIVVAPASAYCACWFRISGWGGPSRLAHVVYIVCVTVVASSAIAVLEDDGSAGIPAALTAGLAVLAVVARTLARRRFARIDWCSVRPYRRPRRSRIETRRVSAAGGR